VSTVLVVDDEFGIVEPIVDVLTDEGAPGSGSHPTADRDSRR
jgi:hypothetical protein